MLTLSPYGHRVSKKCTPNIVKSCLVEIGVAPMVPTSTGTLYSALINTIKKLKTFALQDMYKSEDFPKVFKATEEARASHQIFSLAVTSKSRKYRKPIIPTVFRGATHSWNSPHALSSTPPRTIKLAPAITLTIPAVKRRADGRDPAAGRGGSGDFVSAVGQCL